MKKKYLGVLFLVAALLMTGCSETKEETQKKEPDRPDYYVGVEKDNAPYYEVKDGEEPTGLYVDLMDTLAQRAGFTYAFREMSAAEFVADAENADSEEKLCDFFVGTMETETGDTSTYVQSSPIYETGISLLVAKGQGIRKIEDIRSVDIASRAGTEEEMFAKYLAAKYDAATIVFQDMANVVSDMKAGYAKAIVLDAGNAAIVAAQNTNFKIITTSEKYFSIHRFTAASEKGIPEVISETLQNLQADTTLQTLLQKYGLEK